MAIDQPEVVDAVGIDNKRGWATLAISDHLPWDDEHLEALERKLAAYVRFIESGQLITVQPDARGKEVAIQIVYKHEPTAGALEYLVEAREALRDRGVRLLFGPLPSAFE